MVGYNKHDSLTTSQKLVAGCLSGVITRFITQPLDIVKLRTQVQRSKRTGRQVKVYKTARRIFREEGLFAFWQGHILGQIYSVAAVSSQFYVYEVTTKFAASLNISQEYKSYERFICGVIAGCCSATLVVPLEVIRVRQMLVKDQYGGLLKGAKAVYRYGGILSFYEGLGASVLQMGPQVGISFLVFSHMQPWIIRMMLKCESPECTLAVHRPEISSQDRAKSLLVASTVAGSIAGLVSKTMTYPFDLAKRRLQIGTHRASEKYNVPSTSKYLIKCKNLTDCIKQTIRHDGIRGLFRGWTVTVGKAQVTSIVAFTTYEFICFAMREWR